MSLLSADYSITSANPNLSLYVNGTNVLGGTFSQTAPNLWHFQQSGDGMWSIKDDKSGLYLAASFNSHALHADNSVFHWDIWPSHAYQPNPADPSRYYQLFVHNTILTVTMDSTKSFVFLSDASGEDIYQTWGLAPPVPSE